MPGPPIELAAARSALGAAAIRVEELVRSIADTSVPTKGLEWTVGETAAHLVADIHRFLDLVQGRVVPDGGVEMVAAVNAGHLVQVTERNGAGLSSLLSEAVRRFLVETRGQAGTEVVDWYGGHRVNLAAITCLVLGEVLVHGYDVARAVDRPWAISPDDAGLALDGAIWVLPSMVDQEAANGVRASYDVRVRGGSQVFLGFRDGTLTVEPGGRPGADCHISADPVALLLVGYGRKGQWGPIATGRIMAWGRKPWLGPRFVTLVRKP